MGQYQLSNQGFHPLFANHDPSQSLAECPFSMKVPVGRSQYLPMADPGVDQRHPVQQPSPGGPDPTTPLTGAVFRAWRGTA